MDFQAIIATRRDGKRHTREQLDFLANGAATGTIPDYQLSAWLMAAFLNPLSEEETAWLTLAMADSGERLDLTGLPKPWVDKHSTGGVGDKTSIVLLPLLAACGLTIVKMSGRGLGVTGGTVDKLASVPGFRLDMSPSEMKEQATRIGIAWTGQTPDLAPADKVLYALRDVTGTVSSIPLIASSVLSKKIAGGAETIVLDVKCGSGAFMTNLKDAQELARMLMAIGKHAGLKVRVALTDMNQPLGCAVGNALEVWEAISVLDPSATLAPGVVRFRDLCVTLASITLEASGLAANPEEGARLADEALRSGKAMAKAREWFAAQGTTVDVFGGSGALPLAPVVVELSHAGKAGWVSRVDAASVGYAVIDLGGGRHKKEDVVDPSVGVIVHVQVGDRVESGAAMCTVHAASGEAADAAVAKMKRAIDVAPFEVPPVKQVIAVL
jgi:pyrimidine-nucleoside phosphorylase